MLYIPLISAFIVKKDRAIWFISSASWVGTCFAMIPSQYTEFAPIAALLPILMAIDKKFGLSSKNKDSI